MRGRVRVLGANIVSVRYFARSASLQKSATLGVTAGADTPAVETAFTAAAGCAPAVAAADRAIEIISAAARGVSPVY